MRNHSNENDFDLHDNGRESRTRFHRNGFAGRLALKQRQRLTRKWPIPGLGIIRWLSLLLVLVIAPMVFSRFSRFPFFSF